LGRRGNCWRDIFRFDGEGKIVEHWDVLQPVPASSNNRNTMF
jgi:predicted SnoaL-like aldol condensation-catalyzing enzyme